MQNHLREIIEILLSIDEPTRRNVEQAKFKVTKKYRLGYVPSNSELIALLTPD